MSKENFSISHQMHIDLIKAYNQVAHTCWYQSQAYERMVKQPAPRFYVSAKQAYQVISHMVRGDFTKVNKMQPLRRKMYYALLEVVNRLSLRYEFVGKSLCQIMQHAVTQPAPEFFISPYRARFLRANLNRMYDDEGRVIDEKCKHYVELREKRHKQCERKKKRKEKKWMLEKALKEQKEMEER